MNSCLVPKPGQTNGHDYGSGRITGPLEQTTYDHGDWSDGGSSKSHEGNLRRALDATPNGTNTKEEGGMTR
ncbi:hypothetical protein M378DRAFT_167560 [Amanita muscaria Koide BX008]|uniref:Uncharacterized protein n=1 Tax=Amanita muscaria (strain Koide BX008) TaxID=946122 RepID=A0A0C2SD13_AMAMK|nr:hypothetical protein M378DRAFT_167560 [Amanita muscaria Koide BX008]